MNNLDINKTIEHILELRHKMKELEYELNNAKHNLLKEMKQSGQYYVTSNSGYAKIVQYDTMRYDSIEVSCLLDKINKEIKVGKHDIKDICKNSNVEFIIVKHHN